MPIASINPATGETLQVFDPLSAGGIEQKLAHAFATFQSYRKTSFAQRAQWLHNAARILDEGKREYGRIMTLDMGKTLNSAIAEAEKCALGCRYYAENGERHLADEAIATNASRSFVHYEPIGPVLAVMPWNFPFWQVFRFAAPALMAGNVGLLKHSSNVPQCALAIEDILRRAGFPDGAFQTLLIGAAQTASVLADDRVAAATLTGSEPAGRAVAAQCGDLVKKTVLELGGSDPFIVMPSADFDAAVSTAVKARTINNGQSCIAAKRFILADGIYDEFERRFVETMSALKVGDPIAADTDVGPLATSAIREELHAQVQRAVGAGARLLLGGRMIDGPGYFYEPTVLAGVPRQSDIFREELFGPVAMLFRVRDTAAAIELANDSPFGLGSSVWTRDAAEQSQFIDEIQAGSVFVNSMVASDPRLPFGGVKRSGYGRELGVFGIREFVNIKTVWCK
ncbi:MAG TPA: NAD-dependent succinate-semialdehyde dehydrogenase [Bryobacteraceae bacterium]|jgi:succinate-semialdehyde dehydrogenase / glutarate-semialdehyde dehydrogenase|nr:NAD-dependent succinate-semialdehyde dehydrogenase [Bryobacteraceae bacterium]